MNRVLCILLGLPLIALPRVTHASPAYPPVVQSELGLESIPPCTLCHASELGGANSVTTRFGRSLLRLGVTGGSNTALLKSSLAALDEARVDSDGDGVPDLDELRMNSDPNQAAPPPIAGEGRAGGASVVSEVAEPPTPLTGCSVGASPPRAPRFGNIALWLALGWLVPSRRRSRSREAAGARVARG